MSSAEDFVFQTASSVMLYQTIKISHSSFSQDYYLVSNNSNGVTIGGRFYTYVPISIPPIGFNSSLDRSISIRMTDVGEVLGNEIDRATNDGALTEATELEIKLFRSDDLSELTDNSLVLSVTDTTYDGEGVAIEAGSKSLNVLRTGEIYSFAKFPSMRGAALG